MKNTPKKLDTVQEYCTCGIWIAPHQPDVRVINGRRMHNKCVRQPVLTAKTNCHIRLPQPGYVV